MGAQLYLTPAQRQLQEQLQQKHVQLQEAIMQQQEELQRISEQLLLVNHIASNQQQQQQQSQQEQSPQKGKYGLLMQYPSPSVLLQTIVNEIVSSMLNSVSSKIMGTYSHSVQIATIATILTPHTLNMSVSQTWFRVR